MRSRIINRVLLWDALDSRAYWKCPLDVIYRGLLTATFTRSHIVVGAHFLRTKHFPAWVIGKMDGSRLCSSPLDWRWLETRNPLLMVSSSSENDKKARPKRNTKDRKLSKEPIQPYLTTQFQHAKDKVSSALV